MYKSVIILDDNETSVFFNKDVINEVLTDAIVIDFRKPDSFIQYYISELRGQKEKSLLLLDINMPQILGFEVMDALEEQFDDIDNLDVVIVSVSNLLADLEKSRRYVNIIGFIEKPLTSNKLLRAIKL